MTLQTSKENMIRLKAATGQGYIREGDTVMAAVLGLIIGVVVGLFVKPDIPIWLQPYLPIMVVAA